MSGYARLWCAALLLACAVGQHAARAAPTPASLAAAAARRFPQPVRVGALLRRAVLAPAESQAVLGHVDMLVRGPDGAPLVVMSYGGFLGLGTHRIAVPVDAMVLVGDVMEVVGLKPTELRALPSFVPGSADPLGPEEVIRVGLARPSH